MTLATSSIYFATAAILAVGGLAVVAIALRQTDRRRRLFLVAAIPPLAMAVGYVFMGLELFTVLTNGREQSVARFVGYSFVLLAFAYLVKDLLVLSSRQFGTIAVVLLLTPWTALLSWLASGRLESIVTGMVVVSFLAGVYVLYGPVTTAADGVSEERRLFYSKFRNLFALSWGMLIIQSGISDQALGLTNFFVGQLSASYTDFVFLFGIAGLAVAGGSAFVGPETADQ